MDISDEQVRSLVLQFVQRANQMGSNFYGAVIQLATENGFGPPPPAANTYGGTRMIYSSGPDESVLTNSQQARAKEIFWDLVYEGVIRPGLGQDNLNDDFPFFHLTKIGRQIVAGQTPSPYDPNGYLARIKEEVPHVDAVIVTYLTEALRTFRIGCYLASTVTLGCASEKALLLLIDACAAALPSPSDEAFRKKTEGRQIKNQFEEFQKMLIGKIRGKLPKSLDDFLDVQLAGIFDIIRTQRNAAGHPTGDEISQSDAHDNLYTFPHFLRRIYGVIDWLIANKL